MLNLLANHDFKTYFAAYLQLKQYTFVHYYFYTSCGSRDHLASPPTHNAGRASTHSSMRGWQMQHAGWAQLDPLSCFKKDN